MEALESIGNNDIDKRRRSRGDDDGRGLPLKNKKPWPHEVPEHQFQLPREERTEEGREEVVTSRSE